MKYVLGRVENLVGKGENADYQHFLHFLQCFPRASRVFHDPLVSLNSEGFDPQIFLNDSQNLLFTFFNSYEGGHCDPLNRNMRENPGLLFQDH